MAESLRATDDLLAAVLEWPPTREAHSIAAAITRMLAPIDPALISAPWPTPAQQATAGRVIAAIRRYGGALLADPVGSGKTFIALAVARELGGSGATAVVVPAPLREQWRERAARCGVPVEIVGHTDLSRGRTPSPECELVIVDESHHFRAPGTHRYAHLSRYLVGRKLLLITATPAVNRLIDIAHQLRLGIRDDALVPDGTSSLLASLRRERVPVSLGRVVIASPPPAGIPIRRVAAISWAETGPPDGPEWTPELDRLVLADRSEVASLIRGVLLGAAASSPAALIAALRRYHDLLLQAQDARAAGRAIDRRALRAFTAEAPEQLLFWELLPETLGSGSLPAEDLAPVEELIRTLRDVTVDPKAERLAELLRDGRPSIVFTTAVATVPYLRDRLGAIAPAWVTGARAGWRHLSVPREQVFRWFGPDAPPVTPHVMVASDVAAEGLDLQRAERIVHYDLPWTAMRLAQREGRSRRIGARHTEVEVVTFDPPGWLERRVHLERTLRRKEALAGRAGLAGDASPWRWRQDLAARWAAVAPEHGAAALRGDRAECLVGVVALDDRQHEVACGVALLQEDGSWSEMAKVVSTTVDRVADARQIELTDRLQENWRPRIASYARTLLRRAREGLCHGGERTPQGRALLRRLQGLARTAAKERAIDRSRQLEELITFAARGHTAGEEMRVSELLTAEDPIRVKALGPGSTGADGSNLRVRIVGAILFVPS